MTKLLGFTGTRQGMTLQQFVTIHRMLHNVAKNIQGLHGDCVGADMQFDTLCKASGRTTICYPCTFYSLRANVATAVREPDAPMKRNRAIVEAADAMLACPPNTTNIPKGSGTWATIRYSQKIETPLLIVWPDGSPAMYGHSPLFFPW